MGEVVRINPIALRPHVFIRDDIENGDFVVGVAHKATAWAFSGAFDSYGEALDYAISVQEALALPIIDRSRTGLEMAL